MNGTLFFVLCVIIVVTVGNIITTIIKQKSREPRDTDELADTVQKIELLEERIRVLERIITENRYDLKREIDSL
jgi:Na+-transporting methylmalonyl-CoA/oxaloacetate decarboxylase gamma subunit